MKQKAKRKPPYPSHTSQQKRFVEEYLITLNATKAALAAGYGKAGAHARGSELLKKPSVKKAIDKAIAERSKRTQITQDRVLEELFFLFTSNIDDFEGGDGKTPLRVRNGVDPRYMRAVSSLKKTILMGYDGGPKLEKVEFRLWDKSRAIVTAMRHLGILNDKLALDLGEELKKVITNAAGDFDSRLAGIVARVRETAVPIGVKSE